VVPAVPLAVSAAPRRSGLREYFANIWRTVASIFEGLSVTMSWMFRRPATIQYPDKIAEPVQEMLPESYRGVLEVDLQRCIACLLCQRTCPIDCIQIKVEKNPETGVREITRFDIDMGRCMYCGLCTEVEDCNALLHTTQFEATMPHPDLLVLHFVKEPVPVAKRATAPPRRAPGSILAEVMPGFGRRASMSRWQGRVRREAAAEAPRAAAAPAEAAPEPAAPAPPKPEEDRKDG